MSYKSTLCSMLPSAKQPQSLVAKVCGIPNREAHTGLDPVEFTRYT